MKRHGEALASFDRALAIDPDDTDALNGRGNVLKEMRRFAEALASYEKAVALDPDHAYAFSGMADCALQLCDWVRQDALSAEVRRRAGAGKSIISPLVLLSYADDAALQLAGARRYAESRIAASPQPLWRGDIWRNDRIRIAYVSADFGQHPVAQLTAELFERHDRSRFEVCGLSTGPDDGSALRARLVRAFDQFRDVRAMSDRDIANLLHEWHTDIVVDLTGYTLGCRPRILAHRASPIAVSYLGYPATMGVGFADYIIADRIIAPFDQQEFFAERIVQLPDCYQANESLRPSTAPTPTRREAGLPDSGFVFCCFNMHHKIAAPVFDVWMRLLGAVDGSVLWLSRADEAAAANLRHAAAARGIDPARLIFAPRAERFEDHLARHRVADLFLDTLPYNAHTTASDALRTGLPVLTCRGHSLVGRVAASLLEAVDLPELVTHSAAAYEALGLRLATDPAYLSELKTRLARNLPGAALFDADRFRRHIEAAYVTMWERWQRGEPPRGFAVAPISK
jgi:protein O-GlcNAc transferase